MSEAPEREVEAAMAADRGESESLARELAGLAEAKLASDVVVLDVRELVGYTDFLVVCTARNERQAKAIHDEIYHRMKREGWLPARVEGVREAEWILADYLDCVMHIFTPELRERLKTEPDAAKVHELISNWEPLKSVA